MPMDAQAIKSAADLPAIIERLTGEPGRNGMYHCPICHSGSGPNGTPALSIDPKRDVTHWHCFSCGNQGDVFDLAGHVLGTESFAEKARQVMEWAGIPSDGDGPTPQAAPERRPPLAVDERSSLMDAERKSLGIAREALPSAGRAIEYLQGRGIDLEDARRLGLGYNEATDSVVIPFPGADGYHIDRRMGREGGHKYHKPRGLTQPLWNPSALDGPVVIVVEGPMDAIALDLAGMGSETVALCGTSYSPLVEAMRERAYSGAVLVALDADEAGERAQAGLLDALAEAGVAAAPLGVGDVGVWRSLSAKDASEAWERDAGAMRAAVERAVADGLARTRRDREGAYRASLKRLSVVEATDALASVYSLDGASEPVPTGFRSLDERLGGGMGPGLYVLGATSSLGKTTLLGQIADHVAMHGRPVLFATLEMSASEMAAKGVSRWLATNAAPDGRTREVSSLSLMRRSWRERHCSGDEGQAITWAFSAYSAALGDRLYFTEAHAEPSIEDLRDQAFRIRDGEGVAPLVIIDYLQILRTPDGSLSDKQAVDRNVSALRRMASADQLGAPIFAISSLNRASYSGTVGMEAFKESGAIEYGCDVLLGLQPAKLAEEVAAEADVKRAQRKARRIINDSKLSDVRDVSLTILKNRWGRITGESDGVRLDYHAISNYFEEHRENPS